MSSSKRLASVFFLGSETVLGGRIYFLLFSLYNKCQAYKGGPPSGSHPRVSSFSRAKEGYYVEDAVVAFSKGNGEHGQHSNCVFFF